MGKRVQPPKGRVQSGPRGIGENKLSNPKKQKGYRKAFDQSSIFVRYRL